MVDLPHQLLRKFDKIKYVMLLAHDAAYGKVRCAPQGMGHVRVVGPHAPGLTTAYGK